MHAYPPRRHICTHINPLQKPYSTIKIFHFKSLFTAQHLCRCSVHAHYRHNTEGWVFQNTDRRGMFNQPRSLHVAMHCCRGRLWENRGTISHLYSLQMACVSRIMQIWDFFFLPELKPRCHANRHTHPRHSKILFMAPQSA